MKTFNTIAFMSLCLLYACTEPHPNTALQRKADSLDLVTKANKLAAEIVKRHDDSIAAAQRAEVHVHKDYGPCPVALKKCQLVADGHGGKALVVSVRNASGKKIDMVHLAWTVYNKQGKVIGGSNGKAKKLLAAGKSAGYSWPVNAASGTRATASVAGLHFNDGSVWMAAD
ncbi:MAG: hypothetical protein ACHQHN_05290 [Sphingobacteriales bacterium]